MAAVETAYQAAMQKADSYLYSPLAVGICTGGREEKTPDIASFKIEDYLQDVNQLAQVAPLNERVMDLIFHSQMLIAQPEQLNTLSDRLLLAKGNLRQEGIHPPHA